MDELKKQLAEKCASELYYYDIVDEFRERVDYEKIVDFLYASLAERWYQ